MLKCHHLTERARLPLLALLACSAWPGAAFAQDLEPRRWSHLPVGMNVAGLAYAYTDGDLGFDPVLQIEDAKVETHTGMATYARSFDCFGKTGRLDVIVPYQKSRWAGLLAGESASRRRDGFADPWLRLSVNLVGAPALKGKEYLDYRGAHPVNTVVGAAVAVMLPLGDYQKDKLLNLGQNRFIIRPQAGLVHTRGPWSYELTGSVFFFTDNDEFFDGNKREQDPLYALQSHVIYSFPNRWWTSLSAGYGWGGESEINLDRKDDRKGNLVSAIAFGLPIGKNQALKFGYLSTDTQEDVGSDADTFFAAWNVRF
jgi:hypothetical protein